MAINRYTNPVQNTLEEYIPIPFQEMMQTGQAIQQRGDLAEQQQAQVETGLGSLEALAPGYQQFRDKFVTDYRTKAGDLLTKYGGNTSDPNFIRESKKLNLTFAADPRLQTIKQGNDMIKKNQELSSRMQSEGKLFINPQFSGLDEKGNLTANVGQVQGVNTLDEWTKAGAIAHDSIENNGRGWKTNKGNLDRWKQTIQNDVEGQSKLYRAYISQGYSPKQAETAVKTEIQGLINQYGVKSDKDWAYDNFQLNLAESRARAAKEKAGKRGEIDNILLPEASPINPEDLHKNLIEKVDGVLNNFTDKNTLKKQEYSYLPDTPENRKKYAGEFREIPLLGESDGVGAPQPIIGKQLKIKNDKHQGYNPEHVELIKSVREYFGKSAQNDKGGWLADKRILQMYKDHLKNDNASYTFWNTTNGDQLKMLDELYVGKAGEKLGSATVIKDGKPLKVAEKDNLKGFKGFSFGGVSAAPMEGFPNGAVKINAVDENNNPIQILKPLDNQTASLFTVSNKGYRALKSGLSNSQIIKDKSSYIPTQEGYYLVPQKNNQGIYLIPVDINGNKVSNDKIPFEAYEKMERDNFTNYLTQFSNKG